MSLQVPIVTGIPEALANPPHSGIDSTRHTHATCPLQVGQLCLSEAWLRGACAVRSHPETIQLIMTTVFTQWNIYPHPWPLQAKCFVLHYEQGGSPSKIRGKGLVFRYDRAIFISLG